MLTMSGNEDHNHRKEIYMNIPTDNKNTAVSVKSQTRDTSCWQKNDRSRADPKNSNLATECTICYQTLMESDTVKLEECGHIFHSKCIRVWMKQKRTCPFCAGFSLPPDEYPSLM